MRFLIGLILIFSSFTWSQLVEEKYEEKQIEILLQQDTQLHAKVKNIWKTLNAEEKSQMIFFQSMNKKIKALLAYSLKYKMQYQELLRRYNLNVADMQRQQQALQDLNAQQQSLNKKLQDAYALLENTKRQSANYQNKYNQAQNRCDQSQRENAALLVEIQRLRKEVQMYKTKYEDSNNRCSQAKRDNEDLLAIVNKLRSEKQGYLQQINDANNRYNSQSQSYSDLQKERDALLQQNKMLSATINELRRQLQERQKPVENYDDGNWYVVTGKGSIPRGAIARAWRKAMLQYLKKNYDSSDFEAHENEIEQHLAENWREYTIGSADKPQIVKRFNRRQITIRVRIKEDKLLKDIRYLFDKTRSKLKGMRVALIAERGSFHSDKDVMFDTLQDKLGQDMVIRDLRAIDRLMKKEAQMLGLSAGADPSAYVARKFNQVNLLIYLDVETRIVRDPYAGNMVYATMRCRGVWQQTAQELWKFQITSGKTAKPVAIQYRGRKGAMQQAIKNVALVAYKKIRAQVRSRKTVLPDNVYELKFVNLGSKKRRIMDAIADMKFGRRPAMKILPGSQGAGSDYFTFRVKWLLNRQSIDDIIARVEETCEDNEVAVESKVYSKGVIIFEPADFDDDYDDF
ncbi:hypothetical protein [Candidatus Uabimicrobium amorphum]|uniref:Chromosome partition protein Smc n=1 Tax=Uabimicrobium amorphum TaxID=2596890 RepID=A0A5S9IR63_UABAM|nr:hypothetical protein [Candidatus Uabimicrobium amorphum]BBM85942.1 chromosome partition protein Smc [Candidatus Uabimicrobium amorphum]